MKEIKFTKQDGDNSVKVNSKSVPSLTGVSDDMRELTTKDFKLALRLAKAQRKLDRQYAKLHDGKDVCGRLVMLSSREFKQAIKLGKTLRNSDRELAKAQLVEKREKQARFDKAQLTA